MSRVPFVATSSTNFETIFTAALETYKKQTKKDITSHPLAAELKSCNSSGAILAVLRTQVQTFDQSQSADEKWTKWLDPTVNVLSAFSATLGNSVGLIFPPSNAIFAGIGVLLQAIKDVRASQDDLIDLFGRIEYFFLRLEKYIEVRPTAAMTDLIVKIMVEVLSVLGIVTKEIRQGRTKKFLRRLVGRKDIEDALQRLDKLTQEEARMAAAEALKITRGIDDKVEGVDERVQNVDIKVEGIDLKVQGVDHKVGSVIQGVTENGVVIQQVVNQVTDLNRYELRKDLRKWITPPDPSVNLNTASEAYHEGTAAWCTKGNTLADWKASGSLLWIHGKPGSGKSILSSVIIHDVETTSNTGSAFLAYFYFDFKDTEKQDSRALLSSLLVQLSDQSDIFCDALFSLYSAHRRGSVQPTNDSLAACLKNMIMNVGQVQIYLIVDALDECPNDSGIPSSREKVLKILEELAELRDRNLRLCITSRPEFDICNALGGLATQQVSLHDESGQRQDIVDYVTSVVRSDKKMKRWRDDDKNMVIESLTQKADGMFRWVFCQLEVLRHCFPNNLLRTLEELPKSLDETYKRILNEINNVNREHAYRLLQCLVVAIRPLRVEELAELLAVDFNVGGVLELNTDWRWEDQEEAVLSACSSLVSIIVDNGHRVVQFSHFSVKEFLTSDRLASPLEEVSRFYIPIEPSHTVLAQACLRVLLCLDDHTDEDNVEKIPLLRYAAEYWYQHAQIGNVELQIKDAMDCFFDMHNPHFSAWVRIQDRKDLWIVSESEEPGPMQLSAAPLYFAAWCGFCELVGRQISKHPQQVNHLGGVFGTALHASVLGVHIEVHDSYGRTPLHRAVHNGHLEVARLLLEHDAEVDSQNHHRSTPLLLASEFGHLDVVRLLIGHNADVNARDNDGDTPLHCAALRGRSDVVQILLELNVEINSRNNTQSTPLHCAAEGLPIGDPDVVRLLLDHGADAQARNLSEMTASEVARGPKKREIVQLLSQHAAE